MPKVWVEIWVKSGELKNQTSKQLLANEGAVSPSTEGPAAAPAGAVAASRPPYIIIPSLTLDHYGAADCCIITNPPHTRPAMHALIKHFQDIAQTCILAAAGVAGIDAAQAGGILGAGPAPSPAHGSAKLRIPRRYGISGTAAARGVG